MVQINFARKEINCKIVYYGPGLSGKTTSLEVVHQRTPQGHKGDLTSISTDGDRTLFFDFMPLDLGTIAGMKVKFHLYTVPGQVYYNSTRKLVLLGADGIIFVADSTPGRMDDNQQSMDNLRENIAEMQRDVNKIPLVIQWNKRDLPSPLPIEELEARLNPNKVPTFETSAKTGEGVFQALKAISALVLEDINSSNGKQVGGIASAKKPVAAATPSIRPAADAAPPPNVGTMPDRDVAKVLRPAGTAGRGVSKPAAAAAAAGTAVGATATITAPPPAPMAVMAVTPPIAPREEARPALRAAMNDSKAALKNEFRQAAAAPRRAADALKEPQPTPPAPAAGSGLKMFLFMALGIVAGAAAAVVAAKFLLGF